MVTNPKLLTLRATRRLLVDKVCGKGPREEPISKVPPKVVADRDNSQKMALGNIEDSRINSGETT